MFIDEIFVRFLLGILLNLPILFLVMKKKYLTLPNGIILAGFVGLLLFILHPLYWIVLMIFFVSSSLLSKYKYLDKKSTSDSFAKSPTRDEWQVIANSFGIIIYSILNFIYSDFSLINIFSALSIAAFTYLAVMNADTWATEIGILTKKNVYYILNFRKTVPAGSSGGVTINGTIAGLVGAFLIAFSSIVGLLISGTILNHNLNTKSSFILLIIITVSGFFGMIIDSILGGTIQLMYYCPTCLKETELKIHKSCNGTETIYKKGVNWINNDMVNLISGISASFLSLILTIGLISSTF